MTPNLLTRISRYLQSKNDWVSGTQIQLLATQHGYTHDAIQNALNTLSHSAPFAYMYSTGDDTKKPRARGSWYRWYDMTESELELYKRNNEAWEEI